MAFCSSCHLPGPSCTSGSSSRPDYSLSRGSQLTLSSIPAFATWLAKEIESSPNPSGIDFDQFQKLVTALELDKAKGHRYGRCQGCKQKMLLIPVMAGPLPPAIKRDKQMKIGCLAYAYALDITMRNLCVLPGQRPSWTWRWWDGDQQKSGGCPGGIHPGAPTPGAHPLAAAGGKGRARRQRKGMGNMATHMTGRREGRILRVYGTDIY